MTQDASLSGAARELRALQEEQLVHDELYHRDIWVLPLHHRIVHMALHFSKYAGKIAAATESGDDAAIDQAVVDVFVISMSSANALGFRLSDRLPEAVDATDIRSLGAALEAEHGQSLSLTAAIAIPAGRMAKGCESIDHMEAHPFRTTLSESVTELCAAALAAADRLGLDMPARVRARLAAVEEKNIFHGYLRTAGIPGAPAP